MQAPKEFPDWSPWTGLPLQLSPEVLAMVLDDGQAFRWHRLPDESWLGFWDAICVRLAQDRCGNLSWSAPVELRDWAEQSLPNLLAMNVPFDEIADRLPWRSDAHLAACMRRFPKLRLLRQPFGETLLCFLCSATKQIVQIKQMAEAMAARIGAPLPCKMPQGLHNLSFHRLPSWQQLDACPESLLLECGLGFRARNVKATARFLIQNDGWLAETEGLPYIQAHARLCELPGVGAKIADCVLLYGGGKLEAFPVDTWIIKIMGKHYDLCAWKPEAIAHFGRTHFGPAAGLAQQFLFNAERHP